MIANPLVKGWPTAVDILGETIPIRTGYRTGVQSLLVQDPKSEYPEPVIIETVLALYYGREPHEAVLTNPLAAFEAAVEWRSAGMLQGIYTGGSTSGHKSTVSSAETWDWDHDAAILIADFQRVYSIDLASSDTQMHWYRFMTLMNGLAVSDLPLTVEAQESRRPARRGADKYERERLKALAKRYALPRTETHEEFLARIGW